MDTSYVPKFMPVQPFATTALPSDLERWVVQPKLDGMRVSLSAGKALTRHGTPVLGPLAAAAAVIQHEYGDGVAVDGEWMREAEMYVVFAVYEYRSNGWIGTFVGEQGKAPDLEWGSLSVLNTPTRPGLDFYELWGQVLVTPEFDGVVLRRADGFDPEVRFDKLEIPLRTASSKIKKRWFAKVNTTDWDPYDYTKVRAPKSSVVSCSDARGTHLGLAVSAGPQHGGDVSVVRYQGGLDRTGKFRFSNAHIVTNLECDVPELDVAGGVFGPLEVTWSVRD